MKHHIRACITSTCIVCWALTAVLAVGCASNRRASEERWASQVNTVHRSVSVSDTVAVPPGVDSSVARSAMLAAREVLVGWKEDSIARQLYADGSRQREEGQPLLEAIQKGRSAPESLSSEDSLKSIEWLNEGNKSGAKGDRLIRNKTPGRLTRESIERFADSTRMRAAEYYEAARDYYERALQLNPWNKDIHAALLVTYRDLVVIHRSLNALDAQMAALQKYLDLYGDHFGYLTQLAKCWTEKGDTVQALICYRQAEDALLTWAPTAWDPAVDTARTTLTSEQYKSWIALITQQYKMDYALELAEPALTDLYRLKGVCHPEQDSTTLRVADDLIAWLSWDDGNIATAQLRRTLREQIDAEQWEEARRTINGLLPILSAPQAIFEIEYSAAQIDFYRLYEYDAGLRRMRKLLDQSGYNEVNANLDSLLAQYGREQFVERMAAQRKNASERVVKLLDDFGNCCLTYGIQLEPVSKERAFIYYYQAALVPWKRQGEALSVLADLSRNQPDRTILYGETALQPGLAESLDAVARGTLYAALREAYRRKNDRAHTEFYHQALLSGTGGATK